jgi:hypothetical protein
MEQAITRAEKRGKELARQFYDNYAEDIYRRKQAGHTDLQIAEHYKDKFEVSSQLLATKTVEAILEQVKEEGLPVLV